MNMKRQVLDNNVRNDENSHQQSTTTQSEWFSSLLSLALTLCHNSGGEREVKRELSIIKSLCLFSIMLIFCCCWMLIRMRRKNRGKSSPLFHNRNFFAFPTPQKLFSDWKFHSIVTNWITWRTNSFANCLANILICFNEFCDLLSLWKTEF